MKNKVYRFLPLAVLAIITGLGTSTTAAQQITANSPSLPKAKSKVLPKKISTEFEWASSYEDSQNKTPLIEGAVIRNRTEFVTHYKNFEAKIYGEAVTSTSEYDPEKTLGIFGLEANRKFRSLEFQLDTSFNFMHRKRFGRSTLTTSKLWHPEEETYIRPFISFSGIYALDNSRNFASNGVASNAGIEFISKVKKMHIESKLQFIVDRNSIFKGNRLATNAELKCLFPFGRVLIGPRFELTNWLRGKEESHFEKRNMFSFGFQTIIR